MSTVTTTVSTTAAGCGAYTTTVAVKGAAPAPAPAPAVEPVSADGTPDARGPGWVIKCTTGATRDTTSTMPGRGLFAARDLAPRELLHEAHCIAVPKEQHEAHTRHTIFEEYLFKCKDGTQLLALGVGSLFNHSRTPNIDYRISPQEHMIRYYVGMGQPVKEGEELYIYYGPDEDLWFEMPPDENADADASSSDDENWFMKVGRSSSDDEPEPQPQPHDEPTPEPETSLLAVLTAVTSESTQPRATAVVRPEAIFVMEVRAKLLHKSGHLTTPTTVRPAMQMETIRVPYAARDNVVVLRTYVQEWVLDRWPDSKIDKLTVLDDTGKTVADEQKVQRYSGLVMQAAIVTSPQKEG